jgi:hypothetical protein
MPHDQQRIVASTHQSAKKKVQPTQTEWAVSCKLFTSIPVSRKAHGNAVPTMVDISAEPRIAGLLQTAEMSTMVGTKAVLEQPSSRCKAMQMQGRRNIVHELKLAARLIDWL